MISIIKRSHCNCRKLIHNQFTFKSFSTTPVTNNNNSDEEIVVDTKPNGVYTLSFNNEKKLNPMTVAMGEAFEEKMMTTQEERIALMERAEGRRTVPQIFINDKAIGGYDDLANLNASGELEKLLG